MLLRGRDGGPPVPLAPFYNSTSPRACRRSSFRSSRYFDAALIDAQLPRAMSCDRGRHAAQDAYLKGKVERQRVAILGDQGTRDTEDDGIQPRTDVQECVRSA